MPAPKKPQDHQPPALKAKDLGDSFELTHNGVTMVIEKAAFDDFEVLDDIAQIEEGNAARLPSLMRRLFGDTQYRTMLDGLRDPQTGRVPLAKASEHLRDVFNAVNPT